MLKSCCSDIVSYLNGSFHGWMTCCVEVVFHASLPTFLAAYDGERRGKEGGCGAHLQKLQCQSQNYQVERNYSSIQRRTSNMPLGPFSILRLSYLLGSTTFPFIPFLMAWSRCYSFNAKWVLDPGQCHLSGGLLVGTWLAPTQWTAESPVVLFAYVTPVRGAGATCI